MMLREFSKENRKVYICYDITYDIVYHNLLGGVCYAHTL
jgi:hypothetical protein